MEQTELIEKLLPVVGLQRQWDTAEQLLHTKLANPVVTVRVLNARERMLLGNGVADAYDVILLEREAMLEIPDDVPVGLIGTSHLVERATWFPGDFSTTICLFLKGVSTETGQVKHYVHVFHGTEQHIIAATASAQAANAWSTTNPTH